MTGLAVFQPNLPNQARLTGDVEGEGVRVLGQLLSPGPGKRKTEQQRGWRGRWHDHWSFIKLDTVAGEPRPRPLGPNRGISIGVRRRYSAYSRPKAPSRSRSSS